MTKSRRRVSCLVLMVMGLLAPIVASAQYVVGQPAPGFQFDVENGRVTMAWLKENAPPFHGHTLYAASAPGGPIIAQVFVPPVLGEDGFENPRVSYPFVPPGTYYVIVLIGTVPPTPALNDAWTRIDVGPGCTVAPNPPDEFFQLDQPSVALEWHEAEDGCPTEWFVMEAGSAPGASDLAVFPIHATSFSGYPPAGNYYLRLRAANRFGASPPIGEIVVSVAGCSPPGAPVGFAATVTSHTLRLDWSPPTFGSLATMTGYILLAIPPGAPQIRVDLSAETTSLTVPNVPSGTYTFVLFASTSCPSGVGLATDYITVVVP